MDSFGDFELFDADPPPAPLIVSPVAELVGSMPGEERPPDVNAALLEQSGAGVPPAFSRQDGSRDGRPTSENCPDLVPSPNDMKQQEDLGNNVELF